MVSKLSVGIKTAGYSDFKIENVFFEIKPGELLLITGRSGSGKTTLLYSISNLIKIRGGFVNGYVLYNNINLLERDLKEVFEKIMIIPQEPWFATVGYSVYTEYCHTLSVYGLKCELNGLVKTGLINNIDQSTFTLSAGQYQRLLISEVFAVKPDIILFDEPFTYIDLESRIDFIKTIESFLEENRIVIVVDHIPSNWRKVEPKLIILDNGRVKYYGHYIDPLDEHINRLRVKKNLEYSDISLKAVNIWFKYPYEKPLIKGVNLELHYSEIIGIRGGNGVGKTTLLKILSGIYKPWKGFVDRNGRAIYLPENPLLYLTHPTPRLELESCSVEDDLLREVVEVFDLNRVIDKPLKHLSSGERRRLALASCFLRNYDLYFLDEPSGGLDYHSLIQLIDMINYIVEKKKTVVIAHHDPRLKNIFDKEYLLSNGVLVESN
uniref:ATP-binding cassette domain-containing protein n=1 Tax=Staphylothermus marinus TaxID=2280 RepID=A0A7C4HEQ9_STAMA